MRPPLARRLLLVLPLAAACGSDATVPGPSWFRASISGEVTAQYEGTGDFAALRDGGDDARHFMVFSQVADSRVKDRFYLRWPSAARPAPGTYGLVPYQDRYGSSLGVVAHYLWGRGDNVSEPGRSELYVAHAGEVRITRSTPDEVEGTVVFSGIQVERSGPMGIERLDPRNQPDPAAPRVTVTGTFRVARWDENIPVVPH
ncbi:MAG TPA: hypothetical protein VHG93_02730 [Longimicrobium sp.]|nr:hypothetical protein [Longimicrobium sp.]